MNGLNRPLLGALKEFIDFLLEAPFCSRTNIRKKRKGKNSYKRNKAC